MSMNDAARRGLHCDMNITPLIDVLLVLLIIFMVIVPSISKGESAFMPQHSRSVESDTDAVVLEVLIGSNGELGYRINQEAVAHRDLAARLAGVYAKRAQRVLFVKGDDRLRFTQIAEVIAVGHEVGVDHIGLITPRVTAGL